MKSDYRMRWVFFGIQSICLKGWMIRVINKIIKINVCHYFSPIFIFSGPIIL